MNTPLDRTDRFCIVGAGASGLTVAKNFMAAGIAFDCLERNADIGGTWNFGQAGSAIYQSTHLISSKALTEYSDFPIPEDFPEFISHEQALAYLRAYAHEFGLFERIEFNTPIASIVPESAVPGEAVPEEPVTGNTVANPRSPPFIVTLSNGEVRRYRGVVVANGHNWDPRWPIFPGHFRGTILHSSQYKTPDVLRGKRVLVIGGGNSGCDIACEAAQNATKTFHSLRRGYHYLPKFLLGFPIDRCGERLLRWRLPLWLRRFVTGRMVKIALGSPETFGLPKPDHKLLETHPIINSQMLYYVGHGRISPRPDVTELLADGVRFSDGTEEKLDVIVYATGFKISFPFMEERFLNWRNGRPELFLNVFHPTFDNLFVAGLIQPDSGLWGLVDYQSQLISQFLLAQQRDRESAEKFRRLKSQAGVDLSAGIHYVNSSRHLLEVEHFTYRRRLRKLIREFFI